MRWSKKYPWLLGKVLALAFIFVGGGILATTVVPVALLFPCNRQERTQKIISSTFRFYLNALHRFGMISLSIEKENVFAECAGKIVIANHPSLLDVVVLMALLPNAQCIIKHELWNHRFLGVLMRSAGYIRNDLSPEDMLTSCKLALDGRRCLIIFPEGTRTLPGMLPRFQRGFANIATLAQAPIQTILITCTPPILYKGEPLWSAPAKKPNYRVFPGECVDNKLYLTYSPRSIAARKLVEYTESFYRKMIQHV